MEQKRKKFVVTDFGACSNTQKIQTKELQQCIDACRKSGGGEVIIPAGTYVIGSLRLYSNITLRLKTGAILLGSKELADYCDFKVPSTIQYLKDPYYKKLWNLPDYYFYALITSYEAENIRIIGEPGSVINGQDTFDANGEEKFRGPMGIILSKVNGVHLEGYCFENSANWSHTLDGCQNVVINNVAIKGGHDGFNLHHSEEISISDCRLECGDDCFAGYDIRNMTVEHCYLNTACNGMRIGGEKLLFKHCIFSGPGRYPHLSENTYHTHAIFKYYAIRPDNIQKDAQEIKLENCMIKDADRLFAYDQGKEEMNQNNRPLRDLTLENVSITGIRHTSLFKGNGEKATLSLKNVTIDVDSKEAFLRIDKSIRLDFDGVDFKKPIILEVEDSHMLQLEGMTTMKFLVEDELYSDDV